MPVKKEGEKEPIQNSYFASCCCTQEISGQIGVAAGLSITNHELDNACDGVLHAVNFSNPLSRSLRCITLSYKFFHGLPNDIPSVVLLFRPPSCGVSLLFCKLFGSLPPTNSIFVLLPELHERSRRFREHCFTMGDLGFIGLMSSVSRLLLIRLPLLLTR